MTELDAVCGECGTVHDPDRCSGHSRAGGGHRQCLGQPKPGDPDGRCPKHPAVARESQPRGQDREPLKPLSATASRVLDNALAELAVVAREIIRWKDFLRDRIEALEHLRYRTDAGDAIRAEILLYERALDRTVTALTAIARLNIDERLARIEQAKADMVLAALEAGLVSAGVVGDRLGAARAEAARHLRLVASSG